MIRVVIENSEPDYWRAELRETNNPKGHQIICIVGDRTPYACLRLLGGFLTNAEKRTDEDGHGNYSYRDHKIDKGQTTPPLEKAGIDGTNQGQGTMG